jgi:hypothetical protein
MYRTVRSGAVMGYEVKIYESTGECLDSLDTFTDYDSALRWKDAYSSGRRWAIFDTQTGHCYAKGPADPDITHLAPGIFILHGKKK